MRPYFGSCHSSETGSSCRQVLCGELRGSLCMVQSISQFWQTGLSFETFFLRETVTVIGLVQLNLQLCSLPLKLFLYLTQSMHQCSHTISAPEFTHNQCTSVHTQSVHQCSHNQCTSLHTQSMHLSSHTINAPVFTHNQCTSLHTLSVHAHLHTINAPVFTHYQCTSLHTQSSHQS